MNGDPHPANTLHWLCDAEDGRQTCHHCHEPWPCSEGLRRHEQTDWHRWQCVPIGQCYYARRAA